MPENRNHRLCEYGLAERSSERHGGDVSTFSSSEISNFSDCGCSPPA